MLGLQGLKSETLSWNPDMIMAGFHCEYELLTLILAQDKNKPLYGVEH